MAAALIKGFTWGFRGEREGNQSSTRLPSITVFLIRLIRQTKSACNGGVDQDTIQ